MEAQVAFDLRHVHCSLGAMALFPVCIPPQHHPRSRPLPHRHLQLCLTGLYIKQLMGETYVQLPLPTLSLPGPGLTLFLP